MKKILITILLLSISLFPEIVGLDFTLELRPFVFAVLVSSLILEIRGTLFSASLLKRLRYNFCPLDFAYAGCLLLIVISLLLASQNVRIFHYVFFAVGIFCVYLYFRLETLNCKEEKNSTIFQWNQKNLWLCYIIVFISFINAVIGLYQFFGNKEIVGTFARTSYFGCFLAINVPIVFGIFWWLILVEVYKVFSRAKMPRREEDLNIQYSTRNVQYSSEESRTDYGQRCTDYVDLGMAGSVLCFMIMCLFQFPNKIIPTYLIFNVALAWIVNANLEENSKTQIINNK